MDITTLYQLALLTPVLCLVGCGIVRLAKHLRHRPDSPVSCLGSLVAVPVLYYAYLIFYGLNHPFNFMCFSECERARPGLTEYAVAGLLFVVASVFGFFPARVIGMLLGWSWRACITLSVGSHAILLSWLWTR